MTFSLDVVRDQSSIDWWAALGECRLLIQRDPVSGRFQWYPRAHCKGDLGRAPEWVQASGRGSVFSYSVLHRGHVRLDQPYICALIELEEGVLMLSRLTNTDPEQVRIGMPVQVCYVNVSADTTLPLFEPRSPA